MSWQPQAEPLRQLAECLRDSLGGHNPAAQKNAEQMLKQAKASPDITNYLTYLSVTPTNSTGLDTNGYHAARSAAALLLKNTVKASYKSIPDECQAYTKSTILTGLQENNVQIRNFVGSVVAEIVRQGGILGWSHVLSELVNMAADGASESAQEGAVGALFKICEDNRRALDQEYQTQKPLSYLLPKLVELMQSPNHRVRAKALAAVNVFLTEPIALTVKENIDAVLSAIVKLTGDTNDEVRRFVCRAFALLADGMPEVLTPHVQGIVDYTLSQQKETQNEELALDAAEFFFEASNKPILRDTLPPFLGRIVPVLLDCMVYSEDDQLRLEGDADDAEDEDEEKDIKPQFAASKSIKLGNSTTQAPKATDESSSNGYAFDDEDDELSEGEIEEEDDDDDGDIDPEDEWNLRKCSAAALDSFARHFGPAVFEVTLPWLMGNLTHKDWPNREAAVLALGAIGPGTMAVIEQHLPQLVPYMVSLLKDEQPVVRKITCWALSRFSSWAAHLDAKGKQEFFEPMMDGILQRMLDGNKKVQESAASAFATLEESANVELTPYSGVIIQQFVRCFDRYKDKNMYVLYDCVQTLVEHAEPRTTEPALVDVLMPALIGRWKKVRDQSQEMFPLLECLAFVATSLGEKFTPFAKPFFMRCIRIIQNNLEEGVGLDSNAFVGDLDKDFLVTSLDLLSSIIQALPQQHSIELAASAQPNMFEMLAYCLKDDNNDVKQSAYALLGDCAIYIFPQMQQYLPTIMEIVLHQIDLNQTGDDPDTASRVINNACWSCGEISMRHGAAMIPYVDRLLTKLATIMFSTEVPESLNENAAIAVGRLGIGCHQQLAPHLASFAPSFLRAMTKVTWTDEKGHAYRGFALVVLDNPQAMESCLLDLLIEMANCPLEILANMQSEGPHEGFQRILTTYKAMIGAGWDDYLRNLPSPQDQLIRQLYQV